MAAALLHAELSARFPEIAETLQDDRDLPYLQMHYLVSWLASLPSDRQTADLTRRVADFAAWCRAQPRSETSETDIYTIYVVGFIEHLFETETTRAFLPHIVSKEEIMANAEYLRHWIDEHDYDAALALYKART